MNRGGLDFLSLSSVCDPCGCFISSLFDSLCSEPMQRHASRGYFLFIYIYMCVCVCFCVHPLRVLTQSADLRRSTLDLNHLKLELETGGVDVEIHVHMRVNHTKPLKKSSYFTPKLYFTQRK